MASTVMTCKQPLPPSVLQLARLKTAQAALPQPMHVNCLFANTLGTLLDGTCQRGGDVTLLHIAMQCHTR